MGGGALMSVKVKEVRTDLVGDDIVADVLCMDGTWHRKVFPPPMEVIDVLDEANGLTADPSTWPLKPEIA
jgi:hypothetical protein